MASINTVELVATIVSNRLDTSITFKSSHVDNSTEGAGFASCSGSFENGERFNVMQMDETESVQVELRNSDDTVVCATTRPASNTGTSIGNRAADAFTAAK